MKFLRIASAACLAASFALLTPAGATPIVDPVVKPAENLVVPVRGCHSDVRRHYVPEWGRTATHRHRRDCAPVRAGGGSGVAPLPPRDCHRDARRHFVPGIGRVVHRHVGPDCRVRVMRRHDHGGRNCVQIGPIRYCEG